jgi:hypothetical protein
MTVQADVDTAMASLKTAIAAYTAAGGSGSLLAQWLVSQIKQSDPAVARALDQTISRFVAEAPDRRSFAAIG